MERLLGIDLGTSYIKVGVYRPDGALDGLGRIATPITTPAPGRREMDVGAFRKALGEAAAMALRAAGADAKAIAAVSYSSQANSFVLLDAAAQALTPFIIWQDTRSTGLDSELYEYGQSEAYFEQTGVRRLSPNMMPGKLEWLRHKCPEIWNQTAKILTLSDYLASTLAGEFCGDSGTAALTGLWESPNGRWHQPILSLLGVKEAQLAELRRPGAPLGKLCAAGAALLGLKAGIPLAAGSLDHHAAALGSGLGRLAPVSLSTGTVLAALTVTGNWQPTAGAMHGPDWQPQQYFKLVADGCGAAVLEAFQAKFAPQRQFEELLAEAARVPADASLPDIPAEAWVALEAIHFAGLDVHDPCAHGLCLRALMEAIARRQRALLQKLCPDSPPQSVIATGGGARSQLWLQIKARTLGVPVMAPENAERACLGAAMFASVSAGICRDVAEASHRMVKSGRIYQPKD